jgi:ribosomal protein L7/L12
MSKFNRLIITATAAICKMSADDRETVLLLILESNPTACLNAMKLNKVSFGDEAKPVWNVVVGEKGVNKINIIKMFREETGAGLADAKYWSEGTAYNGREGGVIHKGLSKPEAERHANAIINRNSGGGFTVMVVRAEAPYYFNAWART